MVAATTTPPSGAVEKRQPNALMGEDGFVFDLSSAMRYAEKLVEGGAVPKGLSAGGVLMIMDAASQLGVARTYALSHFTFINGRLGIDGDAARALIRASGKLKPGTDFKVEYFGEPFTPEWGCRVSAERVGVTEPFVGSFTIAQAIVARLVRIWIYPSDGEGWKKGDRVFQSRMRDGGWGTDGPWAAYTQRQLMYRALGFVCRDGFSDVLGGAAVSEELRDIPGARVEGPAAALPSEPDPLLAMAIQAEPPARSVPPPDAVEAEVVHESPVVHESLATLPSGASAEGGVQISLSEQALISALDRLEGAILGADSAAALDAVWRDAAVVMKQADERQQRRFKKLYEQNRKNFA